MPCPSSLHAPATGGRIAIAVRDPQIGRMIALALRLDGYQPHVFAKGVSVFDEMRCKPAVAAVVDMHLRPVDGLTICWQLCAATAMPVILLLMRDEVAERLQAQQAGARALLLLPFTIDELLACVQAVAPPAKPVDCPPPIAVPDHDATTG